MATDHNFKVNNGLTVKSGQTTLTSSGTGDDSYILRANSSSGAEKFYIRSDGVTVVSGSQYFYVTASNGAYVNGHTRLRGGVSNDQGDLSLSDTVNITGDLKTGGTVRLDSSGNLSNIGTINTGQGATEVHLMNQNIRTSDSPSFNALTIDSTSSSHNFYLDNRDDFLNSSNNAAIWITSGGTGFKSGQGAHLVFEGRQSTRNFYFKVGNVTAPQHIMHSNGSVGIGTGDVSPSATLQVGGSISSGAINTSDNITLTSGSNQVVLNSDGALELTRSAGNPYIDFKNSTSDDFDQRLQINSGNFNFSSGLQVAGSTFIDMSRNITLGSGTISSGSITSSGNVTAGNSSNNGYVQANLASSGGTMTLYGYGLEMNRSASYIRPTSDNDKTLYFGDAGTSLDWNAIHFRSGNGLYMTGTRFLDNGRNLENIGTINTGQGATEVYLMNQNVRSSDSPTFQDLTIQGNLNITGDINSYNVTDLDVVDKTITLGVGGTASANDAGGIIVDGANAKLTWDNGDSRWSMNKSLQFHDGPTTTNQGMGIFFTGFDKEATSDYSDTAKIIHTTNTGGHSGSVLLIEAQNDANDGIVFITNASSNLKHNSNTIWTAGNDGPSSGLNADLLDSQQGSYYTNASNINTGTLSSSRLPTNLGSSRTISGAAAILKIQETGVTNNPTWWHVADGGNYSIRLNNTGSYPIHITTDSDNDAVSEINFNYTVHLNSQKLQFGGESTSYIQNVQAQSTDVFRFTTEDGYIQIGAENTDWAHIITDRPSFYFSTKGTFAGHVEPYTDSSYNLGANGLRWANAYVDNLIITNDGSGSGIDADTVDGKHKDFLMHYKGQVSGNWDTIFSQTDGHMGVYQVENISNTDSNYPSGAYTYGGVMSWQLDDSTFKLYAPHTGTLWYQTGWNNDEYSGWRKIWDNSNDGSGSGLDADTLDGNHASAFLTSSYTGFDSRYITKGGSWGAANMPGSRWNGFSVNGGEIAFLRDNPNTSQMSILADGAFYAGENNGFYSLYSGNSYNSKVGFYGNSSGHFYITTTNVKANGNTIWHAGNDGSGSGLDADTLDGVNSGSFLRSDANDTLSSTLKVTGSIIHEFNSAGGYIPRPKGAQFVTGTQSHTGAIKIELPTHGTADMMSFWVDIYDYDAGESVTMWIGGYLYQATGSNEWVNTTALIFTERTDKTPENVRFGADGSNNCIWIGETSDSWNYPQIIVRDFQAGFSTDIDNYDDGWAISFVTSFDTVDEIRAAKGPVTEWDRVEGKPTVPTNNNQLTNGAGYTTYTSNQATNTSSSVSFNSVTATSNGSGTNFKVGDDVWLGDVNVANHMSIRGNQNAANGYIIFGNANTTALGRAGSGALTYGGSTVWHAGNDGSGSGLDADTLDGVNSGSFLRSDTTDTSDSKLSFRYEVSNLNSVSGDKGVTPFRSTFQASNRPGTGNYFTGAEYTFHDNGARAQLGFGSSGNNTIPHLYARTEGWSGSDGWHSWYLFWHSGNDGSGSGLDADTLDGVNSGSFLRSDANDTFTATTLSISGSGSTSELNLGTYGSTNQGILFLNGSSTNKRSTIKTTNGNLHLDPHSGYGMYLNYYTGSGVNFGTGAGGVAAVMGSDGDLWKGNADNSGSKYWHAGNDGSGSGLDADLLDGVESGSFLRSNETDIASGSISFTNDDYYFGSRIGHYGDTNTYMQFHAADQWRVVTGGTERLEANSSGINVNGAVTASGDVTAFSDERLKTNVKTLDGKKVLDMRGVEFEKDGQKGSGVIAQELEKVAPELVHEGEYKSVAYGNLVGYLIEAVKEQQEQINKLTDRINDLEKGE